MIILAVNSIFEMRLVRLFDGGGLDKMSLGRRLSVWEGAERSFPSS